MNAAPLPAYVRWRAQARAYLMRVRLSAACHFLVRTDLNLAEIALRTGFYDQSHFSNQFVRHRGLPPSQYRTKFAQEQELETEALLSDAERVRLSSNNMRAGSKSKLG